MTALPSAGAGSAAGGGTAGDTMTSVLEATGVSVAFAGIRALDGVSVSVGAGERVGLIGPNGAGKTTLFNCLLGILRPDAGRVLLNGVDVGEWPVHRRARAGMGRTFQAGGAVLGHHCARAPADR